MAWLNSTTARTTITIDGEDYSNEFVTFSLTDPSVLTSGVLATQGQIKLQDLQGASRLQDYAKTKFVRGMPVVIDQTVAGITFRHPRGALFILDATYDPETRSLSLDVGCLLTLYGLSDNIQPLRGQTSCSLPPDAGFSELSRALQTEGVFIYTDGHGVIRKRSFFGADGLGSNKEAPAWVSVRDHTALAVSPLGSSSPLPDRIDISYAWVIPASVEQSVGSDGRPYDEDLTESTYWLEHPANVKTATENCTTSPSGAVTCRTVYVDGKKTFAVTKRESSKRYYGGPGGSVSSEVSITEGPAVELNGSYFAERYAWELASSTPGTNVPLRGLDWVVQQRRERIYEYGTGGEIVRTVEWQYRNYLSAMTQSDWRAGISLNDTVAVTPGETPPSGMRGFLTEPPSDSLFMAARITTTHTYYDDRTVVFTETVTASATCGDTGVYPKSGERVLQNIDATNNGVVTTETRTSRGGLLNPDQTPRVPDASPAGVTKAGLVTNESTRYRTSAGPIVLSTSVPYTVAGDTEVQARERALRYGRTMRALLEGDAAGIRVSEAVRPELRGYYPGMPFAFWDRTEEVLLRLRMNATVWGANATESICSTDGIFIGVSNGTVTLGSNTDGAWVPPSITGETSVDNGEAIVEYIAIEIGVGIVSLTGNGDDGFGVVNDWTMPIIVEFNTNLGVQVSGQKVASYAQLLEVDEFGSIPDSGGSLLTSDDGVIIPELFDPTAKRQPDEILVVTTGAPAADQVFQVVCLAPAPDQTFTVTRGPAVPDQVLEVTAVTRFTVDALDQVFQVTTSAVPADQVFQVALGATPPDRTYQVTRGPRQATTHQVTVQHLLAVRTGWAPPDRIFRVRTGPAWAPTPNHTFDVSVGGEGAMPPAVPDHTYAVRVYAPPPYHLFTAKVIEHLAVAVAETPFAVTVGPEIPDEILAVTTGARAADQVLDVEVGPAAPDQVWAVTVAE